MNRVGGGTIAMLICIAASGCAGGAGNLPQLSAAAPAAYRLGPGDQLRISVQGLDAMNNTYTIGDTGAIAMPLVDVVPAEGKTIRELEVAIASRLLERKIVLEPKVTAQIQTYRPFFVLGEVQRPGAYPYVPGMSVMTAASLAGGYTFRANTKTAIIKRASTEGRATSDTPVLPGDIVQIRETLF
ncbi:polysaccharide biosynthesis/export family protein [Sphingomonas aerophila]|uniref:Polysaccharide export outer membrane protein n=1 Tax=Sphingomonas aerophila TaxID=1344948 RepID=A0A7W9BBS1_9SPHN|nr:polysaccharide biosynthesis/export family protein [Sphingomonas aerophila]MBB5714288.1 polysaccharide export outer membrane protein [Sphingomonas aerophila]